MEQQHQNTQVIQVLLQARAEVHLKNTYGRTPLHYAAMVLSIYKICTHIYTERWGRRRAEKERENVREREREIKIDTQAHTHTHML